MSINKVIPRAISVGYRTYGVNPLEMADHEMTEKYGWCDKVNNQIYIYTNSEPMVVADTLLHEILHAVWFYMGLDDKHDEEAIVNRLATGFTTVLYDNPEILDFVKYCVELTDEDEEDDDEHTFEFSTKPPKDQL